MTKSKHKRKTIFCVLTIYPNNILIMKENKQCQARPDNGNIIHKCIVLSHEYVFVKKSYYSVLIPKRGNVIET